MPAIGAVIAGAFTAVTGAITGSAIGAFLIRTAISVGLSLLAQRLMGRQREPGQRIDGTSAGEDIPQSFILGRYLTGGHLEYHGSHGDVGGTPNAFYTLVISLSDVPGTHLRRVRFNDQWGEFGDTDHPDYGKPVINFRKGGDDYAWVKYRYGFQTGADAMLVDRYSDDPDQPWTAQHIGTGVAYAIVTLRFDREQWQGVPRLAFELDGIPVYDPRLDSTRGGSGPQRADDPATWAPSTNLAVLAYNLLLGIPLPDGSVYGGGVPVDDIPLANAVAGMNVCDAPIGEGDDERPQFHGGLEIRVDQEPAEAIEELLKAGLGQISELGGVFRTRWGAPDLPVLAITDEDLSISDPQSFEPFPGLQSTHNAVRITHPSPDHLWEPVQTPADFNAAWEAQDGGRRLPVQMVVPACFDHGQAQQLAHAYAEDNRRWRQHQIVLPGDAQVLEALDTITWTSARNGYSSKLFEVVQASYRPGSLFVALTLRERDPDDYDWSADFELPAPPAPAPAVVDLRVVATADWGIEAVALRDNASEPRRPGLRLHWTPAVVEDAASVQWQLELSATNEVVASGTARAGDGAVVFAGALPETTYRARIRPQLSRPTGWTDWKSATTLALYLTEADLDPGIAEWIADLFADAGLQPPRIVDELPLTGEEDELVWLRSESRLYRWNGSAWVTLEIAPEDLTGKVELSAFTQGIRPVEIVEELPASGNAEGRTVVLTTDGKLYRFHDGDWTAAVASSDIAGQLTNAQIAALEAAKLTGQITQTQITDGAISTSKLAATAVTADKLAASAVVADKIAANAVTAAKIQTGAVTADKVAANAVTADKLAANAVTAGKIAAGAVSASEIAAGAIVASRLAVGDITNLVGTADMTDEDYWSQPAGVSFVNGGGAWQSERLVRLQGDAGSWLTSLGQTFEVEPGSSLYLGYNARIVAGTGTVYVDVQTSAAASFSSPTFQNVGTVASTSITNRAGTITVPAGHRYARVRLIKGNNGTTDCFIGKVVCRVAAGGELIVDGAITAGKIAAGTITGDRLVAGTITGGLLAASGIITNAAQINNAVVTNAKIANAAVTNAKISGAIQSDNFASGSTGWQINKNGNAQFNNLIVRGSLVVGAVSDIEQQYLASDYRWTNTGWTQRASILLGPVSPTDLWQMHFSAQMRRLGGGTEWINAEIAVDRRVQIGGTWQGWNTVAYHNNNWTTNWHHYNESEAISGDFTNVQYRVQQKVQWNGDVAGNNYRRIALSARKITR